jgi:hypothetical protein
MSTVALTEEARALGVIEHLAQTEGMRGGGACPLRRESDPTGSVAARLPDPRVGEPSTSVKGGAPGGSDRGNHEAWCRGNPWYFIARCLGERAVADIVGDASGALEVIMVLLAAGGIIAALLATVG